MKSDLNIKDARILIVDDADFSLYLLKEILESNDFTNIETAQDGEEALIKTDSFNPELVILDLVMPKLDGFEYCKKIRASSKYHSLPLIVQSGTTDSEQIGKAFDSGATDFIGKPINAAEVIARVKVHIENQTLLRDLKIYKERVARELDNAKSMQKTLLPSEIQISKIEAKYNLSIGNYFESSSEIGGDFWGIMELSHAEIALYIVDFAGHGVTAALNTFRLHTILQEETSLFASPELGLSKLNKRLVELLSPGQYATMFYSVINTDMDIISYATAGSLPPILINKNGHQLLQSEGVPLGIDRNSKYEMHQANFVPGDFIMLYSDALIETLNRKGKSISEEEVIDNLNKNKDLSAAMKIESMLALLCDHCKSEMLNKFVTDDLTMIICQRN